MSNGVNIDSSQVDRLLDALSNDELKQKILFDAVKEGAQVIRRNAVSNLTSRMSNSANLVKNIKVKGDKAYTKAKVNVMYLARFFEAGTNDRYTKGRKITGIDENSKRYALKREGSGHFTGSIKPLYYFRDAVEGSEAEVNEAMARSIDNALKNIN